MRLWLTTPDPLAVAMVGSARDFFVPALFIGLVCS